jgi:hypothetical protein
MLGRTAAGLSALALLALPCSNARAHGVPPTAYAVVAHDAQGARAVRLSTGLALRRAPQRFQFVCPAAWGDEYAAPLGALDDGTIVVGAQNGLMLLAVDGKVRAHPDPAAIGISTEIVRGASGVFSLRTTPEGSEVLAIDAEKVRVLWRDSKSWYSLAAFDDKLLLLRADSNTIEQLTITAAEGKELERQVALLGSRVDYAFARATAGSAYALVLYQTAPELGSLRMNSFSMIAEGLSSIAGPLKVGANTLLAVDGQLSRLVDGAPMGLAERAYVLCLEQDGDLPYACKPDGIARVTEQALGEPLFQLSWLVAPNQEQLAAGKPRERCDYQWQDMRFDLIALGTPLLEDTDAGTMMGAQGDAGASAQDAAQSDEDTGSEPADQDAQVADAGPAKRRRGDCSALPPWRRGFTGGWLALLALALLRRRTRLFSS